jgi:hypothetical protein
VTDGVGIAGEFDFGQVGADAVGATMLSLRLLNHSSRNDEPVEDGFGKPDKGFEAVNDGAGVGGANGL